MMNMDLSRVMDAYRGQEDKLRKRVQLSNDLLELIAYEQLTREKRQLMAAKQAQAMPPGGLPTIRDQKEEEAFELTKQELAQQVGKTLQQQQAMRQQAMSRGVAAAPGAQNVMPQQAMAAGGIVAFEDGGPVTAQYNEMALPNAPGSEPSRTQMMSAIARMDDATVTATASRLVGAPINSPTQARLTLAKMFGDKSLNVGMSGTADKLSGLSLGASAPMMGGTLSAGVDMPRGRGNPMFNLGYNRQFDRGGIVAFNGETGSDVRVQPIPDRTLPTMSEDLQVKARREMAEMDSGQRVALSPDVERFLARDVSGRAQRQAAFAAQEQQRAVEAGRSVARQYAPPAPSRPALQSTADLDDPLKQVAAGIARQEVRATPAADLEAAFAPSGATIPPRTQDAAPPPPRDTGAAAAPDLRTPSAVGTGIASALAGAMPPSNDALMRQLQGEMRTSLLRSRASRDQPQMAELARLRGEVENLGTTFPKESPEARRQAEAEQARLEQRYAQMMDPEKQRLDNLIAFLAGGAGRRGIGSVLGGAAESANRARAANEAFGLQALKDMQAGRQAMRGRDVEEQRAAFQARQRGLELGAKVAEVAAQIESQTDIADRKIDSELAAAALGALSRYGSDLNKIKAEVQTKAAQLGYEISRDDLNRIAQIAVAQIGADVRGQAAADTLLSRTEGERARIAERLSRTAAEARDNPMLSSARAKDPARRSAQEKRIVEEYENALANDQQILNGLDRTIADLRARQGQTTPPPAATGSARSQGVTVTSATAPPR